MITLYNYPLLVETSVSSKTLLPPGISLKLEYNNTLPLPFSELHTNNQICSVDGFLSINENFRIEYFSFIGDCLQLSIGQIILPNDFTHAVYFTKFKANMKNPSILIYSKLKSSKVSIGDFFHINTDNHTDNIIELHYQPDSTTLTGSIHNVNISLFDAELKTDLLINATVITFKGRTTIFDNFEVDVNGISSTESDVDSQSLDVSFEVVDGHNTFKKDLTENLLLHMKTEYNNIIERQANAEFLLQDTESRLNKLTVLLQKLDVNRQSLLVKQSSVNESVNFLKTEVDNYKDDFDLALKLAHGNSNPNTTSCSEKTCQLVCDRDTACSTCQSKMNLNKPAICDEIVTGKRLTTKYRYVESTLSRYESRCYPCSKLFWYALPIFTQDSCCYTESVTYTGNTTEPYESTEYYSYIQKVACATISDIEQDVSGICCTEDACAAIKTLNTSCTVLNAFCRQQILNELISGQPVLQLSFEKYEKAKSNLTLLEIELSLLNKQLSSLDQEYDIISTVKDSLSFANKSRKIIEYKIKKDVEKFLPLYDPEQNRIKDIEILNVSFTYILSKQTPLSVPARVIINYDNQISEFPVTINFQESLEIIHRHVSLEIFNHIAESNSRRKRETVQSLENNYLSTVCQELNNLELFIFEVTASLNSSFSTYKINMELLHQNMISNDLKDLFIFDSETFEHLEELETSFLRLLRFKNTSLNRMEEILTDLSFMQWQMSIDNYYANGTVITENSIPCIGLADCFQSVIYNLVFAIEDTQLNEAKTIKQTILSLKDDVLAVALNSSYSFMNAEQTLNSLLEVFQDLQKLEYWCSDPPTFIEASPLEINVSLGSTLDIPCIVYSKLPVTYLWKKNSIISSTSSNTVSILNVHQSDSGEYQCIATNSAGCATSLTTVVNVFSKPVLNLTLDAIYEVYEGYDNGVRFTCDAKSWPLPGWKWFYQSSTTDPLTKIEGESRNTLTIISPKLLHEGWYTCMAYNELGETISKPSFLLVLPSTLSTFQYIVNIAFTSSNEEIDYNIANKQLLTTEIRRVFEPFTLVTVDDLYFIKKSIDLFHVAFSLHTPQFDYLKTRKMTDIIPIISPTLLQLEESVKTLSSMATASTAIIINNTNITLYSVSNSLQIGPRYVSCSEGYEVSSNYIICGKNDLCIISNIDSIGNGLTIISYYYLCSWL